jgi:hypothetical protein
MRARCGWRLSIALFVTFLAASGDHGAAAVTLPSGFQETVAFSGLEFPTAVRFAPDGRVFVAEQSGLIKVFDNLSDPTPTLFADLSTNVYNNWDRGLLGLALDPQFTTGRPYVYVLYAYDAAIGGVAPLWGTPGVLSDPCPQPYGINDNGCVISGRLSRLTASGNTMVPGSETVLVNDWCQQYPSHSVGSLFFGADGALYASGGDGASFNSVDYGQFGIPKNPCNDPPGGTSLAPPTAEGGALRSQDLRTLSDPTGLNGAVLRVNPDTGAGLPDNPRAFSADANERRIVAEGLRNPFRFTIRPGTSDVWIGDVGWNDWEEIDHLGPLSSVTNFGWPCYEGVAPQGGYDGTNLNICENLYTQGGVTAPVYTYKHTDKVVPNEACTTGTSSITGVAFYNGGTYPATYNGALFFADFSRNCIWAMFPGGDGLPNPNNRITFGANASGPVDLEIGPGGDLFYVEHNGGAIRRIRYLSSNNPPNAVISANPTSGTVPLTVQFDGTGSNDPDGDTLTYAWDLDGDGALDDSTASKPTFTYTTAATVTVKLQVSDPSGATGVTTVVINAGNTAPVATMSSPSASLHWAVGETIDFSGSATDAEEGALPPSKLKWSLDLNHCFDLSNCHVHHLQDFVGVASGSFVAPDHDYPSYLQLTLTATDSGGATDTETVRLDPRTVDVTFATQPSGLQISVGSDAPTATPFTKTRIVGSTTSMTAPSPQSLGATSYQFASWSDGGAQTHTVSAPATPTTYTATFNAVGPSGLVGAWGFEEPSGTTVTDKSGNNNNGTLNGPTRSGTGKFGAALSFDGVNDMVTVPDSNSLDLTSGMTLEAWVNPSVTTGWKTTILKEQAGQLVYALYASTDTNRPSGHVFVGGDIDTRGTAQIAVNTWTHLAATYDGTLRLYVNGVLASSKVVTGPITTSTGALRFGGNGIWTEWFQGLIDEVRVYNRALSAGEIQTDMTTPVGTPGPQDTQPPSTPGNLVAQSGVSSALLTWTASSDNVGVHHYDVHRSTTAGFTPSAANRIAQPTTNTYTDSPAAGNYYYRVIAYDAAGNASQASNEANATVGDTQAPTAPTGLTATGGISTATLGWTASSDNVGVHHYDVHRSTTAGFLPSAANRIAQPTTNAYNDTGLAAGTYFYKVIAYDAAGNASQPSNEASATITGDVTAPTVSVTAPTNGTTVSGTTNVTASASDNVAVAGVQFKVDGTNLGSEDTTAPYSVSWDTTTVTNAQHDLTAVARDAAGNSTTSTIVRVTVDNTAPPPPAGLVASYSFNGGTGTTTVDSSGNANTGTISGAAWITTGKYGNALSFDGVNDWVTVNDASSLDLTNGMTLSAWIYPAALGGVWRTVILKEQAGQLVYALYANTQGNRPSGHVFIARDIDTRGNAVLPLNTWSYLATTYDGATIRLYVNGTQVSSKAVTGSMPNSNGALRIGGNSVWTEWFQGRIDEVRVYRRALSAAEVQTDMNRPLTP